MKPFNQLLLAAATVFWSQSTLQAQVDCNTPQGVLALMAPSAVKGSPTGADAAERTPTNYLISWSADLFLQPQSETTNRACMPKITYYVFASTTSASLSNLPNLATSNDNFTVPSGVRKYTATLNSGYANRIEGVAQIPRSNFTVGTTVFYRVARRIDNCTTCTGPDPYTWSSTFSFKAPPLPLIDKSGFYYQFDTINGQIWMLENLRTLKYSNGTTILTGLSATNWAANQTGAVAAYGGGGETATASNTSVNGAFYNWYAVANPAGLCPTGWHVPSMLEWNSLFSLAGGTAVAGVLKNSLIFDPEAGCPGCYFAPNTGAGGGITYSGKRFLMDIHAAGEKAPTGETTGAIEAGSLWSSTIPNFSTKPNNVKFLSNSGAVTIEQNSKSKGLSVRCKKN